MVRWHATATWLAPVAVLCGLGCRQDPDVVAQISPTSVEPTAGSAGAGMGGGGSGGTAGTPNGGGGGRGGSSVSSGSSGSAGSGGNSGSGGSLGAEPPIPAAGSPATGTAGRTPTEPPCPLKDFYPEVVEFTESDCLLRSNLSPGMWFFIITLRPVPLMGETRPPADCERLNIGVETANDGKTRLCINLCDDARNWLVNIREANACLKEAFPLDEDTGS